MHNYQQEFLELAIHKQVLRFGRFELKSGRISPYFFNAGLFNDGRSLAVVGRCFAQAIDSAELDFDMLFGPAYKGIPLVAAVAIAMQDLYQKNIPFTFNRKEIKDHGEGGQLVGAELTGRVLVIDDVISAGTSVRESAATINKRGAELAGVAIALDRQERGSSGLSAAQEVEQVLAAKLVSVVDLDSLVVFLEDRTGLDVDLNAVREYRDRYGV